MPFNFDPNQEYILENDRILLRPLREDDWKNLAAYAINEPDTWQFSLVALVGEEGMKNYVANALAARETGKEYPFIVFDKQTNSYAGSTRFYDIQPANSMLQLGYTWYGEKFRGTGLNRNCKYLLLSFAFEEIGAERVEFRADNTNHRSVAAMKAIGCKVDGVLRSHAPKPDGTRRDSIVLSILKSEWLDGGKEMLKGKI